ncbi:Gfo/Idh/MocA family oxidoreductase [Flavobacteriaceae bacterium]|nr:Gfo/Idh/MocA family oxidoreductase [Flavobacteriaceae bacterium]
MSKFDRRKFIKTTSLSAAFASTPSLYSFKSRSSDQKYMGDFASPKLKNIKAAFIGVGYRGKGHLNLFASLPDTEVVAISDLYEDNIKASMKILEKLNKPVDKIKTYWGGENKWKTMLNEVKPDIVFISTDWNSHGEMAIETMKNNAHAFVEVPLALSIKQLWEIVDTSEKYNKHCMMMENVNYGREELMFLNIIRNGHLGDLLHAEAAYIHDLRFQMFEEERGTGSWRTLQYEKKKGNLYPTHGLGPVSQYMNLLRSEDNFKTIVSFSSPAMGRKKFANENFPENHKWNELNYQNGDLNTSIIKTHVGRTIMVQWDETSPRPYTRLNLIQGTKGILAGGPTRAAFDDGFENFTDDAHQWIKDDGIKRLYEKYDHPLFKRLNNKTKNSGHGGMDGIMIYRIVECLQNGTPLDQNLYEGCAWSALIELTSNSVNNNGEPQEFPDFTRGNWVNTKPFDIIS